MVKRIMKKCDMKHNFPRYACSCGRNNQVSFCVIVQTIATINFVCPSRGVCVRVPPKKYQGCRYLVIESIHSATKWIIVEQIRVT
jgi:hypothetical protein